MKIPIVELKAPALFTFTAILALFCLLRRSFARVFDRDASLLAAVSTAGVIGLAIGAVELYAFLTDNNIARTVDAVVRMAAGL